MLKLALAGMVAASLGAKAYFATEVGVDQHAFVAAAEAQLRAEGWSTSVIERPAYPEIRARRGSCAALVADYPPHGTLAPLLERRAAEIGGALRFAYRGEDHEAAPKLRPLLDFFVWREAARLGLAAHRHPVVAFAVTPGCPDPFDRGALASLPPG